MVQQIRPEAERKLRAGFQRRVDAERDRNVVQLTHAAQLADQFECGEVAGVFTARVGGGVPRRTAVRALLPLAALPLLFLGAAAKIPGALQLFAGFPFLFGAWFGLTMWLGRNRKRQIWCYAFAGGFVLLDGPRAAAVPVRWSQVTEVSEVWTNRYDASAEESRPVLTAYRLRSADGQAYEITRSFENVEDPYKEAGRLLQNMMPASVAATLPTFPTIDQIIASYARP